MDPNTHTGTVAGTIAGTDAVAGTDADAVADTDAVAVAGTDADAVPAYRPCAFPVIGTNLTGMTDSSRKPSFVRLTRNRLW